jgi:hypothetical protein
MPDAGCQMPDARCRMPDAGAARRGLKPTSTFVPSLRDSWLIRTSSQIAGCQTDVCLPPDSGLRTPDSRLQTPDSRHVDQDPSGSRRIP